MKLTRVQLVCLLSCALALGAASPARAQDEAAQDDRGLPPAEAAVTAEAETAEPDETDTPASVAVDSAPEPLVQREAIEEEDSLRLPEVMVTSQKISQTLEEVPASVSTLDGDFIRKSGLNNIAEFERYTPNVSIALNNTAGTFAIRGFATPDTNPGFDPSVGAVIDGIYYGRSQFINAFYFDVDRIEVLRGPQGTLFGKNSTAGVFNLVTRAPTNEFGAAFELMSTSFGANTLRPMLQFPLGEKVSLRLSGNFTQGGDGTTYNTKLKRPENNPESGAGRLRLRYTPDENATLDVEAFTSRERLNNNGFQFTSITPQMLALARSYDPQVDGQLDRNNSADFHSQSDGTIRGASASFNYDLSNRFGIPELNVITVIAVANSINDKKDLDADFSPVNFISDRLVLPGYYKQTTDEVRFVGRGEQIFGFLHGYNFVTGGFLSSSSFGTSDIFNVENLGAAAAYCNASASFCGLFPGGSPIPGGVGGAAGQTLGLVLDRVNQLSGGALDQFAVVNINQTGRTFALFGQFEAFLLPEWALIGGLRYGDEVKDAVASSQSDSQLIKGITAQQDHNTPLHTEEVDYSPKAGVKWAPNRHANVYLTWSRGFKSGGFNARPLSPENLDYEPEQATSIELGAKGVIDFLGGPLRIGAALFNTTFDNLQVSTFLDGNFVVLNAAAARSRGFDFDMHWLTPVQGVSITASAGYADARYRSYPCAPAIDTNTVEDTHPACINETDKTKVQDLSGKRLSYAPRVTASLIPAYQLPVETLETTLSLDILYRGDRYLDVDLDPKKLQPATTVLNTRLTLESPTRTWGVSLVAHNLTDQLFGDQAISQPLSPGNVLVYRTDYGRYISGNLTVQF